MSSRSAVRKIGACSPAETLIVSAAIRIGIPSARVLSRFSQPNIVCSRWFKNSRYSSATSPSSASPFRTQFLAAIAFAMGRAAFFRLLASRFFSRLRSFASRSCAAASIRFTQLIASPHSAALEKSRASAKPTSSLITPFPVMFCRPIYRFCLHHNCRNAVIRPASNGRDHTVSPEPNTAVGHRCFREGPRNRRCSQREKRTG